MGRKPLFTVEHVASAIQEWVAHHGVAPTVEELRRLLRAGSTRTVWRYLRLLETEGYIERWPGARGLRSLKAVEGGTRTRAVPLVGEAPAGPRMLAEENREGWVRLPEDMFARHSGRFFLLRVRGDSMNRARLPGGKIEDKDLVLVREQPAANPGEIVVALIDGEATIKRLVQAPGYSVLRPESTNPRHEPIVVTGDAAIQGVVRRVLKRGSLILQE